MVLGVLTRPFPRTFLVAAFRSPQVPSRSLPSLSIKTRKDTLNRVWACPRIGTHVRSAGSRNAQRMALVPLWRRSRSSASNRTSSTLKRRCLLPGRRRNANVLSASSRSRPVGSRPPGRPPGRPSNPGSTGGAFADLRVQCRGGATLTYGTTGTGKPACSARYWDASLRSDGGISGPPYSIRSLAITRACRGILQGFPDTVRAISAGPAPGAPSPGAPSPTDPPPERPFPGRRPARSRCRARAGSGSTRPPHR